MEKVENPFASIVNGIEKMAAASITVNDGDYIADGLLHCGNCHTPKQTRVQLFGVERTPMCLCKCESEKRKEEERQFKWRERQQEIAKLRQMGFPEKEMEKWTFDADDRSNEKLSNAARKYVENFREMKKSNKGLLLYGHVGTGKTFYAACIANALIGQGHPCLMTNFARLVNTIQGMYEGKQEYIDGLNRFDLLILDDLASERDTEYMNEIVQNIVDSRYRAGLPTIVTTNLTAAEIKNPADMRRQRTYSRLLEMTIPVEVKGNDRRRAKASEDYKTFHDLLGL